MCHSRVAFATLTYKDEALPPGGTLVKRHYQLWLKGMRKALKDPKALRFFLVGEYGSKSFRPHYHAALFGVSACVRGRTNHKLHKSRSCCSACNFVQDHWPHGEIDLGELTPHSASYIARYVVKKMTRKFDPRLINTSMYGPFLEGEFVRQPEFARMSLKPGIGALAVPAIGESLTSEYGCESIIKEGDVPGLLNRGRFGSLHLGRYLKRKIREELGHKDAEKTPESVSIERQMQMSQLYESALQNPKNEKKPFSQIFREINQQKIMNFDARLQFKKGNESL